RKRTAVGRRGKECPQPTDGSSRVSLHVPEVLSHGYTSPPIRGHREKPQVHGVGLEPGGSRGDEEGASTAAAAPNPARPSETRASASAPSAPSRRRADPCPRRGSGRPAR